MGHKYITKMGLFYFALSSISAIIFRVVSFNLGVFTPVELVTVVINIFLFAFLWDALTRLPARFDIKFVASEPLRMLAGITLTNIIGSTVILFTWPAWQLVLISSLKTILGVLLFIKTFTRFDYYFYNELYGGRISQETARDLYFFKPSGERYLTPYLLKKMNYKELDEIAVLVGEYSKIKRSDDYWELRKELDYNFLEFVDELVIKYHEMEDEDEEIS